MNLTFGELILSGYLLALGRTVGFVLVSPPFNTRAIPGQVRAATAFALAIPMSTWTTRNPPELGSGAMIGQMLLQMLLGVALGYFVLMAVAAIQTIGDLIDLAGGFSITQGLDPLSMVQSSVMGRLHQLIAITLLFGTNGHLVILRGLSRTFEISPTARLDLSQVAETMTGMVSTMFLSAIQITAPILAALLIADVALGLLTRAAPALNAFALAFPLKIVLSLFLIGLILVQIPGALENFVSTAGVTMIRIVGG
ncbi:flagellar biosynthetic protein FliR [Kineosporia sp. J2-2]|uniref:Flagellar biosynthetic protein FliR n=1 Tax=Kineosporia corallincola TaxID=2835133 RepID=A0ABS5TKM9_9ACTN|nr:flagellar biosynthetic protein FliR [Kineosporia corallincola]MBT0771398.1 flagellar biosynthetic protein FliR [Kineosporia corallincola]